MFPIQLSEQDFFYDKAINSDATKQWLKTTQHPTDKTKFFEDWKKYYFQDKINDQGRSFHILLNENKIGQISHHQIQDEKVKIDLMIYDETNWDKGYGSSAIKLMTAYLEEKYHVQKVWMQIPTSNKRAIKAYENAGFEMREDGDNIVMLVKK